MAKTMAVNAGGFIIKIPIIGMPAEQVIAQGVIERIGMDDAIVTIKYDSEVERLIDDSEDEDHITLSKNGKDKKI